MSRGLGRIERTVLTVLEQKGPMDSITLAAYLELKVDTDPLEWPRPSTLASVRRALSSLRRKGQVLELCHGQLYVWDRPKAKQWGTLEQAQALIQESSSAARAVGISLSERDRSLMAQLEQAQKLNAPLEGN